MGNRDISDTHNQLETGYTQMEDIGEKVENANLGLLLVKLI